MSVKREEALRSESEQDTRLMKLRCEKAERKAYSSQEDLVKDLTSSRDVVGDVFCKSTVNFSFGCNLV